MERERKRRKWDVPAPGGVAPGAAPVAPMASIQQKSVTPLGGTLKPGQPITLDAIERAKQAAAAVANKFTMGVQGPSAAYYDNKQDIGREVIINDAPSQTRYHLTKKPTQDDIASRTRTVIVTRGRYYPPGAPVDENEKPLHLKITPATSAGQTDDDKLRAVNAAAGEIQRILQGEQAPKAPSYPPAHPQPAAPAPAPIPAAPSTAAVYVGFSAPPEFGLPGRLRGPGDQYIRHISGSGVYVVLRGLGSGMVESPEPLHFYISGPTPKQVDAAKSLAQDLVNTVKKDLERMYPHYAAPQHPLAPHPSYPPAYPPQPAASGYPTHQAPIPHAYTPQPAGNPVYAPPPGSTTYPPPHHTAQSAPAPTSAPPAQPLPSSSSPYPYTAAAPPAPYPQVPPGSTYPPPVPAPGTTPYPYPSVPGHPPYTPPPGAHVPYAPYGVPPPAPLAVCQAPVAAPQQHSPPKRRFRESKDDNPQGPESGPQAAAPSAPQYQQPSPSPYAQQYPQQPAAAPAAPVGPSTNPGTSHSTSYGGNGAPPGAAAPLSYSAPPPIAGSMGPPPPRLPQGVAAAGRVPPGGSGKTDDASVTGGPKLVDYDGED